VPRLEATEEKLRAFREARRPRAAAAARRARRHRQLPAARVGAALRPAWQAGTQEGGGGRRGAAARHRRNQHQVAVAGATGRMGHMLIEAIRASDDCRLAGALDIASSPAIGNDAAGLPGPRQRRAGDGRHAAPACSMPRC
jgi:hypothetical protein